MDVRAVTFLSSFLLVIKGNLCISLSNSVALSSSLEQSQLNQFTVPAVIKPIVTFDSSNLAPPNIPNYSSNLAPSNIPNYSSSSLSYQQPPLPIIIDNVSSRRSSNSLSNLLFLVFALKNNKKGGCGNCGGCNGGGFNCGGCNCNGCNYPGSYGGPGYYGTCSGGSIILTDPNTGCVQTEIIINGNGSTDETTETGTPITIAMIEATLGSDSNEVLLTIKPVSC